MAETGKPREFQTLLRVGGLPELGPGPREHVLSQRELDAVLTGRLRDTGLSATSRDLIRALILLWHDHLEAAHIIAQGIEDADGGFLHGIVHRREPDYGNARYWFRRTVDHPAFPQLAERTGVLLNARDERAWHDQLIPGGEWDAFAFIDLCEQATTRRAAESRVQLLREIQALESEVLLGHFLAG